MITIVIADYGREEDHTDLANRFLQHAMIARYTDAKQYQENCEALGREPLSTEDMAFMEQQHDLLVERYGRAYEKQYGWATGVDGRSSAPTFRDLERLVDLSHLRWHYRQQSHEVHADATGWETNVLEHDGTTYLTIDRVDFGLAEPAHLALVSLHQCAASLFAGTQGDIRTEDVVALKTLAHLVNEAKILRDEDVGDPHPKDRQPAKRGPRGPQQQARSAGAAPGGQAAQVVWGQQDHGGCHLANKPP